MSKTSCLPCLFCRVLGYLCLNRCARHTRRGTVCGSLVKKSELPVIFNQLSDKSTVRKVSSRILSEVGNLAFIIAVRVEWNDGSSDEYVLKTMDFSRSRIVLSYHPHRQELASKIRSIMVGCHNAECTVYEFLRDQPGVKMPAIYFTLHASDAIAGMIIMENLTPRAKMEQFTRGLDLEQMLSVVEALAQIHIASLKSESWQASVNKGDGIKQMFLMFFGGMAPFISLSGKMREFSNIDLKKITDFFTSPKYLETLYCHRGKLPDVLVHGDMLANNIMFELLPDGKIGKNVAAIIDWQLARAGNPFDDMAKLLSWGAHVDVYEHHRDAILGRYLEIMRAEELEGFQVTDEDAKSIWMTTLAAHSIVSPVIVAFMYKFNRAGDAKAEDAKQGKKDHIRKSLMAYEFAVQTLF